MHDTRTGVAMFWWITLDADPSVCVHLNWISGGVREVVKICTNETLNKITFIVTEFLFEEVFLTNDLFLHNQLL